MRSVLFPISINELDDGINCSLSKFVDSPKLGEASAGENGCYLETYTGSAWAVESLMKFSKAKWRVLQMGRNHSMLLLGLTG